MTAAVVAAVVALVFGVLALTGHGPGGETTADGRIAGPVVTSPRTSAQLTTPSTTTRPTTTPTTRTRPTMTPTMTTRPTTTPSTSSPWAAPSLGNDVVTVSADAARHPLAPAVVDLVTRYFRTINSKDFATYRSLFTAAVRADLDVASLTRGYRSTQDSEVQLLELGDSGDGRTAARISFTSNQDAVDGPEGQSCTVWDITLFLQPEGGRLAIGAPADDYRARYRAC